MPEKLFLLYGSFQFHHFRKEIYEMAVALTYFLLINLLHGLAPTCATLKTCLCLTFKLLVLAAIDSSD